MVSQFYWPNWWKIYPTWWKTPVVVKGNDGKVLMTYTDNTFCLGPFQCRWYS